MTENIYPWTKRWLTPFLFIPQLFFLLVHLWSAKTIICSFGGYWSVLPSILGKLVGKPVYIVLNGTDCAAITSVGYGVLRKPFAGFFCGISYKLATGLLPVSEFLIQSKNTYSELVGDQGVRHHFPNLTTDMLVVPNGFNSGYWQKEEGLKREKSLITIIGEGQFERRDGALLLQVAHKFPECQFTVVGVVPEEFEIPSNINVIPIQSQEELRRLFSENQFYIQLSLFEGFGCALCEAMCCECIPIASNVNETPEIVGNSGFTLPNRDIKGLEELLDKAITAIDKQKLGEKARERVIAKYPIENRIALLKNVIEQGL